MMSAQNQKIGKANNLKVSWSKETKRHKSGKAKSAEVAYTRGNGGHKKNTTISV